MIILFLFISMGLVVLSMLCLILKGGSGISGHVSKTPAPGSLKWPKVTMIVPSTGDSDKLKENIKSLLDQEYPEFEVILVTRDTDDPATPLIHETIHNHLNGRHVFSGRAVSCGQKNHNILVGISASVENTEIFVFCDSTRVAPEYWLKQLVEPIADGSAPITSGYHHVIAEGKNIVSLGQACSVLFLYFSRGFQSLVQPWGGSTAIRKDIFHRLDIANLWNKNIVDDVSLASLLSKQRIDVKSVPGACLSTYSNNVTLRRWNHWLVRQWIYLKFCMPLSWLGAGFLCYYASVVILLAVILCIGGAVNLVPLSYATCSFLFLILFTVLGAAMRYYHPKPGPVLKWTVAVYATVMMASWSHLRTLFTMKIHWKGITYEVAWKGYVKEIRE